MPRSLSHAAALAGCGLVAVLAMACASSVRLVDLGYWRPPDGQTCRNVPPQGTVHALVDSAALAERIPALDLANGDLLLSVAVDSGEVQRLRRIEDSLLPGDDDRLEGLVARSVRNGPREPAHGRLLVRVRDGEATELRLTAYQVCPPALDNEWLVSYLMARIQERDMVERTAKVWLAIDTAGRVTEAEQERVPGLRPDTALIRVLETATFHPALIDREPVSVWASVDVKAERPILFIAPRSVFETPM